MRFIFILVGIFCWGFTSAQSPVKIKQQNNKKVIQLSGIVISGGDSIQPLHYVNIGVKNSSRGISSNYEGFFSLPIYQTDTLIFSTIGYQKAVLTLPQDDITTKYSIIQTMQKDTIRLPETVIYPWPSREAFKRAFIELDIPDDEITIARKNLEREALRELGTLLPVDGKEAASTYLRNESKKYTYMGQTPPQNLFNPFAWVQFFKMLKEGKLKLEK